MKERIKYGFGPHLMLDCFGCPKEKLSDMDLIFDTLDKFPEKIRMTKIMPPYVFRYHGAVPEDWGISGVVLIAESHITIHTFPDKNHAFIDIFSCKDFDISFALDYMLNLFEAKEHEVQLSSRGTDFPRHVHPTTLTKGQGKTRTLHQTPYRNGTGQERKAFQDGGVKQRATKHAPQIFTH